MHPIEAIMAAGKQQSPGERIAGAISDFMRAADVRYADRTNAQATAYQKLVRTIDEALGQGSRF